MSCEEERNIIQITELYQEAIDVLENILVKAKAAKTGTEIGRGAGIGLSITSAGALGLGLVSLFVPPLIPLAPVFGWVGFGVGVAGGGTIASSKIEKQILNKKFIGEWKVMENAIKKAAKRSEDSFLEIEKVVKNLEEKYSNKPVCHGVQGVVGVGGIAVSGAGFALPFLDDVTLGVIQVGKNIVPLAKVVVGGGSSWYWSGCNGRGRNSISEGRKESG
ncbi:hypothetical protein Fcan01_23743 [Folsomia candida]|uniref:Uncharacterized protein n=1 Tax=Folsomia candida TaxID=158441 RepID=A0A226D9I3_FOLCA|nr:hypothetical protein Fcan01_23743 [Folsomia candida]